MDVFMDKIFEFLLGGSYKFVTDKSKNKIIRAIIFALITVLCFAVIILLLYSATYFKNIFIWVVLISCSLIVLSTVFTFIKKVLDSRNKIESEADEN